MEKYLTNALVQNITSSFQKYDDIMQDDYAGKFEIYRRLVTAQAAVQIHDYMLKHRAAGWLCVDTWSAENRCCADCVYGYGQHDRRCLDIETECKKPGNSDSTTICEESTNVTVVECPNEVPQHPNELTWVLNDANMFYDNMEKDFGIPRDWIELGDFDVYLNYGCIWAQHTESKQGLTQCRKNTDVFWHGFAMFKDDYDLPNPANIIKEARDKTNAVLEETKDAIKGAESGLDPWRDISSTLILPALSLASAVENMEGIVKTANDEIERERKEGIADFITAIFFFIPIAGEIAASISLTLRIIIDIAGALADTSYSIYDAVHNKNHSFATIMGIIFSGAGALGVFKGASTEWRAMKGSDRTALPKTFNDDVNVVRKLLAFCKSRK